MNENKTNINWYIQAVQSAKDAGRRLRRVLRPGYSKHSYGF